MNEKADKINVVPNIKVRWKGVFDFEDLYKSIKEWLNYKGFGSEKKSFKESKYVERIKPNGKQLEIEWVCEKIISDYFSIYITLRFFIIGLKDVEVPFEGKKLKMSSGDIEIRINSDLVLNRQGRWNKESFMKKFYEKVMVKDRITQYKDSTYEVTMGLQNEIKTYLNLHQF